MGGGGAVFFFFLLLLPSALWIDLACVPDRPALHPEHLGCVAYLLWVSKSEEVVTIMFMFGFVFPFASVYSLVVVGGGGSKVVFAVQKIFPSLRHYFTFSLIYVHSPCILCDLKIDQGLVRKKLKLI